MKAAEGFIQWPTGMREPKGGYGRPSRLPPPVGPLSILCRRCCLAAFLLVSRTFQAPISAKQVDLAARSLKDAAAAMRRAQTPPPVQPSVEEGSIPHAVHLQASTPLDGSLPVSATARVPAAAWLPAPGAAPLTSSILPRSQGVAVKGASLLAWHPTRQRLLTASTAAVVEYDAVSGSRRNLVEVTGTQLGLAYTPSGAAVILLTKVRRAAPGRPRWLLPVAAAACS